MQRLDRRWGLDGRESRGYRSPEADSRGSEGAVGLVRRFRGYRDLDLTLHAVLSWEQVGLGSSVPHGCQSWAQCRAQRPVTPAPSCPGWQGADVTPVPSATLLYYAVVRLTLREWLDVLVGWEIGQGGGDGVDVELASCESVTESSSEASWRGASGELENRYLIRGLGLGGLGRGGELVPRPRPCGVGLGRIGESAEASWLSLGFDIYKV